jgi:hypothetical protein
MGQGERNSITGNHPAPAGSIQLVSQFRELFGFPALLNRYQDNDRYDYRQEDNGSPDTEYNHIHSSPSRELKFPAGKRQKQFP